jgi:hypothetical protein
MKNVKTTRLEILRRLVIDELKLQLRMEEKIVIL